MIVLIICSNLSSQTYHPIVYENSGWNNVGWIIDGNVMPESADLYNCYFHDDTLISGLTYHKHYFDRTRYYFSGNGWHVLLDSCVYIGCMRDNDKMYYFIPNDAPEETLLYDFNKGINDTIPLGFFPNPAIHKVITDTIMQPLLDGSFRIGYFFQYKDSTGNYLGGDIITESIGNRNTLVHPDLYTMQSYDGGYHLFSYCENGQLLYLASAVGWVTAENCDFTVLVEELQKYNTSHILVEPNPVAGSMFSIRVGFPTEPCQKYDLKIYNDHGQIVYSNYTTLRSNIQLPINVNLHKGCYFLRLSNGNKSYSAKFIKL